MTLSDIQNYLSYFCLKISVYITSSPWRSVEGRYCWWPWVTFENHFSYNSSYTIISSMLLVHKGIMSVFLTCLQFLTPSIATFLPRDAMQARPMPPCCVCLSVRVSVTFVHSVKTNKDIFEFFFTVAYSHAILGFPYQTGWRYSDGTPPPNGGVECRCMG